MKTLKVSEMKLLTDNKGEASHGGVLPLVESAIIGIIGIVILFKVVASLFPTLVSAGQDLNASGLPLGSLFAGSNAVLFLILSVVLVIVAIGLFFGLLRHSKGRY